MYFGIEKNGLSLSEIAAAVNGTPYNFRGEDAFVYGVCTDTRKNPALSLFIALKGENFDGHDFIGTAYSKGAICAVTDSIAEADILVDSQLPAFFKDSPESFQVAMDVTYDCIFHDFHLCIIF